MPDDAVSDAAESDAWPPLPSVIVRTDEPRPGVRLLVVVDELDMATTPQLRDGAAAALRDGPQVLALDLAGVEFIASTALAALVALREQAADAGCRLCLVAPSRVVRRAVELLGLGASLPCYDTLDEALS